MITIELPRSLGVQLADGTAVFLENRFATVKEALDELGRRSPAALDRVMNERGEVRQHVNVFVNDENIRYMEGLASPVPDGSTIYVLAAVSGG
jgi:molybdopterin converting factor small subunit